MTRCGFCDQPVPDVPTTAHTCKDVPGEIFTVTCPWSCGWTAELVDGMEPHTCEKRTAA